MENPKLNKPILLATMGEFLEAVQSLMGTGANVPTKEVDSDRKNVYGVRGLAKLLGCSISTAQRRISSGALDDCIRRNGRLLIIDSEGALDALKKGGLE